MTAVLAVALGATSLGAAIGAAPAGAVAATTRWVNATGTPSAPGSSCASPGYSTIAAAITAATAGDTIKVCAGTYNEKLTINKALTLEGAQAGVVPTGTARAGGETKVKHASTETSGILMSITASNVTIDGFELEDFNYGISVPGGHTGRSDIAIRNNWLHSATTGSTTPVFQRGIVLNLNSSSTADTLSNLTIEDNLLTAAYGSSKSLIGFSGPAALSNLTIADNTFDGPGYAVFHGGTPSAYTINTMSITGNTLNNGTLNIGNITTGTLSDNTFKKAGGTIGMFGGTVSGNSFLDGARFGLWGRAWGFPNPSTNITITNNLFNDNVNGRGLLLDSNAANSWGLATDGPPATAASIDATTITVHDNAFNSTASGNRVRNLGLNALDAGRNYWGTASGPALTCTNPDPLTCDTLGSVSAATWIHSYTDDPAKAGKPGFWPTAIVEGFPTGTPVTTDPGTGVEQSFYSGGSEAGSITFGTVGTAGQTTVTARTDTDPGYVAPSGFSLGTSPTYYEVTTTAAFSGEVTVCLHYTDADYPTGTTPALFHYSSGAWADVTSSIDTTNHVVCGIVTSLSPFALGTGAITVNAVTDTKDYDGTADSSGSPTLDASTPLIDGNYLDDCTQSFADAAVGTDKTITASGCKVYNAADADVTASYEITYVDAKGTINVAPLTGTNATVTVSDKTYDGTTAATITGCTLTGTTGDVSCSYADATATFNNRNAGATKAVTVSGLKLSGTNAANYSLTGDAASTATISKAALTIDAVTDTKPFDGTTTSSAVPTVTGVQSTDTVTGLTQAFDSSAVGARTLSVTAYTVNDGNSGANYTVTTNTAAGSIGVAMTTMAYVGPLVDADGNGSTTFTAQLASGQSTCKASQTVEFFLDYGTGWTSIGTATANSSGLATLTKTLAIGTYPVKVAYNGTTNCAASMDDTNILTVGDLSGRTHGGGWYYAPATATKVHFGFNVKATTKSGKTTVTGDIKWTHDRTTRLKSRTLTGITNITCPTGYVKCAAFTGTGDLSTWVLDPTKRDGGYWGAPTTVSFTVTTYDGGTTKVCSGKTCTNVDNPDAFGIDITGRTLTGETAPLNITKGNVKVN